MGSLRSPNNYSAHASWISQPIASPTWARDYYTIVGSRRDWSRESGRSRSRRLPLELCSCFALARTYRYIYRYQKEDSAFAISNIESGGRSHLNWLYIHGTEVPFEWHRVVGIVKQEIRIDCSSIIYACIRNIIPLLALHGSMMTVSSSQLPPLPIARRSYQKYTRGSKPRLQTSDGFSAMY